MTPTPLVKLDNFYIKREDCNLTGSAKDRALSCQISTLIDQGFHSAVISSSGNAAISALYFCSRHQIDLTIFVSPKIEKHKLALISQANLIFSSQAVSDAFKFAKTNRAYYLRQSTDPSALIGYQQIGSELSLELPKISSIFIPVGSGTTLLGISQKLPAKAKIFAVQPACHPSIAGYFDNDYSQENSTITDALSVKMLPLKSRVIEAIKKSSGKGIVVQNQNVIEAQHILLKKNINTSAEGALALAGFYKAAANNLPVGNFPVILLTGAIRL